MKQPFDPSRIAYSSEAERALSGPGLSLARWYDLALGRDAEIARLIEGASGHHFRDGETAYACDGRAVLERRFLEHQATWPAVLDGYDLFVEWCDTGGTRFALIAQDARAGRLDHLEADPAQDTLAGLRAVRDAKRAARAVHSRFVAMIDALRSGALEAWGHHHGAGEARISPAIWDAPKTRIDFAENEIHARKSDEPEDGSGPWRRRVLLTDPVWSGVALRRPAVPKVVPLERSRVGNPGHLLWSTVFDRMLVDLLRPQDYPESAAHMARLLVMHFEAIGCDAPDPKDIKRHIKKHFPAFYERCKGDDE